MATTTSARRPRGPRVRGSGPAGAQAERRPLGDREQQYDLLTAALIGAVLGAGTTMLLRPRRRRVLVPGAELIAGTGRAATLAAKAGRRGARWMKKRGRKVGSEAADLMTSKAMSGFLRSAKERIDDAVTSELKDLRQALRRQRRRLGI